MASASRHNYCVLLTPALQLDRTIVAKHCGIQITQVHNVILCGVTRQMGHLLTVTEIAILLQ